jgi:non-specific serine/threonine protein kinase
VPSDSRYSIWWVDLSAVSDSNLVSHTVAATLGIRDYSRGAVTDNLVRQLQGQALLLVFDNCEHVIDGCVALLRTLLGACPDLKILATSREPLGIAGEEVLRVLPLAVPSVSARPDEMIACDAVRLFVERAKHASPFFVLSDRNAPAVAQICRSLDGLPLAVELAAVRVKVLSPDQIASRLDDVFQVLGRGERSAPVRHQTLKTAFDWSWQLLAATERRLLAALTVFTGTFTLSAVESVCGGIEGLEPAEMLDLMQQLVDRSLITVMDVPSTEGARCRLLSTVRQYAREHLGREESGALARRHAEYFLRVAQETAALINGAETEGCLARLDREYDNIRAALEWACHHDGSQTTGIQLSAALWRYWLRRYRLGEGRLYLETTLARGPHVPAAARAEALLGAGVLATLCGDAERARVHLEESVSMWRALNDLSGTGRALRSLGGAIWALGDPDAAAGLYEEGIDLIRRAGRHEWELGVALFGLGNVRMAQGRLADAMALYQESAAILRSIPDPWTLISILRQLAVASRRQGRHREAEQYWRECLVVGRPIDDSWFMSLAMDAMAKVSLERGDRSLAVRLFSAAEVTRQASGRPALSSPPTLFEPPDAAIDELRTTVGEATFCTLWREGHMLSRDEAIALALSVTEPLQDVSRPTGHTVRG